MSLIPTAIKWDDWEPLRAPDDRKQWRPMLVLVMHNLFRGQTNAWSGLEYDERIAIPNKAGHYVMTKGSYMNEPVRLYLWKLGVIKKGLNGNGGTGTGSDIRIYRHLYGNVTRDDMPYLRGEKPLDASTEWQVRAMKELPFLKHTHRSGGWHPMLLPEDHDTQIR